MSKTLRTILIAVAVICFAVALYAPVSRFFENRSLDEGMDELRKMKQQAAEGAADLGIDGMSGAETIAPPVETPKTDQGLYIGGGAATPSAGAKTAAPDAASGDAAANAAGPAIAAEAGETQENGGKQTPVVSASPTAITDQSLASTAPFAAETAPIAAIGREIAPAAAPSAEGIAPVGTVAPAGILGTPSAETPNIGENTDQSLYQENLPRGEAPGTFPAPSAGAIIDAVPTAAILPVLPGGSPSAAPSAPGLAPLPTPAVPGWTPSRIPAASEAAPSVPGLTPLPTPAVPGWTPSQIPAASEAAPSATPAPEATPSPTPVPTPAPTPFVFDENKILPEYRELYAQNADLVGWLKIDGTPIDYPVLQSDDEEYYMKRDFFGRKNYNGQLILDADADPFTPSMNLVISGHNMKSGKMFGRLQYYASASYAGKHPIISFDTLFRKGEYKVVAAFYTWDYTVRPDGFQYNVNIEYRRQMTAFLEKLDEIRLYDTGVSVEFGDELIMLSTCSYQTGDGRFVVVARRLRAGEES